MALGFILLSAGTVYWAHRVRERERLYRESLIQKLQELDRQWNGIQSRRSELANASIGILEGGLQTNLFLSDGKAANEELDREEREVRESFAVLEKTVKKSNGGLLPEWVKEHRTWRELVQALSKFG